MLFVQPLKITDLMQPLFSGENLTGTHECLCTLPVLSVKFCSNVSLCLIAGCIFTGYVVADSAVTLLDVWFTDMLKLVVRPSHTYWVVNKPFTPQKGCS